MEATLYFTKPNDPNLLAILTAAKYLNLTIPTQEINKKYDPLTLLTPEGPLNQPITILQYLSNSQLSGHNEIDRLRVWQWFEHLSLQLHPLLRQIYEQMRNQRPQNKEKYQYSLRELQRELQVINNHLKIRTFLVGDSATVVDIHLATHLDAAFKSILNEDTRKKIPNLTRWFLFMRSQLPFKNILGEPTLCGKVAWTVAEGNEDKNAEKVETKQ